MTRSRTSPHESRCLRQAIRPRDRESGSVRSPGPATDQMQAPSQFHRCSLGCEGTALCPKEGVRGKDGKHSSEIRKVSNARRAPHPSEQGAEVGEAGTPTYRIRLALPPFPPVCSRAPRRCSSASCRFCLPRRASPAAARPPLASLSGAPRCERSRRRRSRSAPPSGRPR